MIAIPFQPREIAFLIVAVWYLKENITKCCMGMERKKKVRDRERERQRETGRGDTQYVFIIQASG